MGAQYVAWQWREGDHQTVRLENLLEPNHAARVKVLVLLLFVILIVVDGEGGAAAVATEEVGEKEVNHPRASKLLLVAWVQVAKPMGDAHEQDGREK